MIRPLNELSVTPKMNAVSVLYLPSYELRRPRDHARMEMLLIQRIYDTELGCVPSTAGTRMLARKTIRHIHHSSIGGVKKKTPGRTIARPRTTGINNRLRWSMAGRHENLRIEAAMFDDGRRGPRLTDM